jgi:hypothetical protein
MACCRTGYSGSNWIGFDVEIEGTEVFDPNDYLVPPQIDGLKMITLPAAEKTTFC